MDLISVCMPTIKPLKELEDVILECTQNLTTKSEFVFVSNKGKGSAYNRNQCLKKAKGDYIIMIDDDVFGYTKAWDTKLLDILFLHPNCLMLGARLLNPDGSIQNTISKCNNTEDNCVQVDYLPGAVMFFKKSDLLFNEEWEGWSTDDIDYELEMKKRNPNGYFLLTNLVKLKHKNEMKNEKEFGAKNKELFRQKWGMLVE